MNVYQQLAKAAQLHPLDLVARCDYLWAQGAFEALRVLRNGK